MFAHLVTLASAVRPEPGQARSWVERELSRPEYHRSLTERFLSWLGDRWDDLTQAASGASPLSTGVAVLVAVALVALLGLAAGRLRREPLRALETRQILSSRQTSPDEHRAAASAALETGSYDVALVEAFRALASRALRRGLADPRPGLTAHELAADLAPWFPVHADELRRAAESFDLVFYGDQPAAASDAHAVLDLDDVLRVARPARSGDSGVAAGFAAPR